MTNGDHLYLWDLASCILPLPAHVLCSIDPED